MKVANTVLEEGSEIQHILISFNWLNRGEMRLDASYYAKDVFITMKTLEDSKYPLVTIKSLAYVFNPPPLKRNFTNDSKTGTPYLYPSELLFFKHRHVKFVFAKQIRNVEDWYVKRDWIILTQSGNVGIPVFVTKSLEDFIISQNAIRVVPKVLILSGFLFAYLCTWIGQTLLRKDQFGVTVKHLRPHHVESIPVPLIHNEIQKGIHEKIVEAYRLRDEAKELLDNAEKLLYEELRLPELSEVEVQHIGNGNIKAFSVKSSELNLRFDASYHTPIINVIEEILKQGKYPVVKIADIVEDIFLPERFKRIYVDKKHGIPFLQPMHLVQIKPYDLKFVSHKETKNVKRYLIGKNWVLMARSGTVGRVGLATSNFVGWLGSDDILRIIPDERQAHPGYLMAYLLSPYGFCQATREIYGGVIDHIEDYHVKNVLIPFASSNVQEKIGKLVVEAYEKREEANKIEEEAVKELEVLLASQ